MPAPNIYFSAISVAPAPNRRARSAMVEGLAPHARDPATSLLSVCDTWDELDLRTFGLQRRSRGSWFGCRAPTAPALGGDTELRVERVVDTDGLAAFERMMVAGFGARPPIAPFDIHAPAILADPAMHVLAGWVDDELVTCAMTYVTEVAGIYGVATLPTHRRRGHASAMTVAAASVAPGLVAVLQPAPEAGNLYRRLGFEPFGGFSHWA